MLYISPSIYFFQKSQNHCAISVKFLKIKVNVHELQTLFDPTLNSMSMSITIGIKIENQF